MDPAFTEFIDYVIDILDINSDDDFLTEIIYNFIRIVNDNDEFPINLDDLSKWLDVNRHKIRKTLVRSYNKGKDYVQTTEKIDKGQLKYVIRISKDCFKELCMKTKSKYGDLIRKYFVVVEKMYREYMLNTILDRQRTDGYDYADKNYENVKYPIGNAVYILRILQNGVLTYKIGFTDNINRRLSQHRRNIPGKVTIVLYEVYKHHRFLESCLHRFLEKYQIPMQSKEGKNLMEIFETDIDKIRKLILNCREFSQSPEMLALAGE